MRNSAVDITGSWMVATPGQPGPDLQHWVRTGAKTEPYVYGHAPYSVCRTLCIPADAKFRRGIALCPNCVNLAPPSAVKVEETK